MLIERFWHELNGGWIPAGAEGTQESPSLPAFSKGTCSCKGRGDGPRGTQSILRRGALVAGRCPLIEQAADTKRARSLRLPR
jgi:hypothetical protein